MVNLTSIQGIGNVEMKFKIHEDDATLESMRTIILKYLELASDDAIAQSRLRIQFRELQQNLHDSALRNYSSFDFMLKMYSTLRETA